MNLLIQNVLLALLWMALSGEFTIANFVLGFVLGSFLLWLGRSVIGRLRYFQKDEELPPPKHIFTKAVQVIKFVLFFIWEIIVANIDVMLTVLSPRLSFLRPAIIAIPLDVQTDAEITLLANMITLTPGTLSLDVSFDKTVLYVHCFYVDDLEEKKQEIKQSFERLIHEVVS